MPMTPFDIKQKNKGSEGHLPGGKMPSLVSQAVSQSVNTFIECLMREGAMRQGGRQGLWP